MLFFQVGAWALLLPNTKLGASTPLLDNQTPTNSNVQLNLAHQVPTLIAADDVFGKTFLAGMAIAAAAITSTVCIGVLVRSRYDEVEASFFAAQDEARSDSVAQTSLVDSDVADFYGDVDPTEDDTKRKGVSGGQGGETSGKQQAGGSSSFDA